MQRMKQLARSSVYWPHIDQYIEDLCKYCVTCGEKHPWMLPEKTYSLVDVNHAINFMDELADHNRFRLKISHNSSNLIKLSKSTLTTTRLLDEDFADCGYHRAMVSDNATTFSST